MEKSPKQNRYCIEFTAVYHCYAENEEEAKEKWSEADFGEAEDSDISEIRVS